MTLHETQVWDLPTRTCHWVIMNLFLIQLLSSQFPLLPTGWHLWAGYLLLLAVLFRIAWGLVGSQSARFAPMISSLGELPAYLPLLLSSTPTRWPGHNPVGALSSLLLLFLLLVSCVTGLFIETWAEYRGPLSERVSRSTSIFMADLHGMVRWPLYLLVCVHALAVFAYLLFKREDRIGPMLGRGRIKLQRQHQIQLASNRRATLVLVICLTIVLAIVMLGPVA